MIDELIKVANSMRAAGISAKDWHPKLKPLPKVTTKAPCIRIWLTDDGHVYDLEPIPSELVAQLRKFEPDNGKSFPGFNIRPLYIHTLPDTEAKRFFKELETRIRSGLVDWTEVLQLADDLWAKDTIATINRIFTHIIESLKEICSTGGGLDQDEILMHLLNVVAKINAKQFQKEYCEKVKAKVSAGALPLSFLLYLGKEGKESKFSVFLDIKNYSEYPVAHPKGILKFSSVSPGSTNRQIFSQKRCSSGI